MAGREFQRIALPKEIDTSESEIEAIKIECGKHGHHNHEKQVAQSVSEAKHGDVDCGGTAKQRREYDFSVRLVRCGIARFPFLKLPFYEHE